MGFPPFLTGIFIAVVVAVAALPADVLLDGGAIQPATQLRTDDSKNFQVPLNRQGANVFVDDTHGFDEMFEDLERTKADDSPKGDGSAAFMSEMEVDDKSSADTFMKAFAKLDKAANVRPKNRHPKLNASLNPNDINMEAGPFESFEKNLGQPPSTPISDYTPETAAALATDKRTAATTSLAFEKYKKSPFALQVVGKDAKAKLSLTNPSAFKKLVEAIKKGVAKHEKAAAKGAAAKGNKGAAAKGAAAKGNKGAAAKGAGGAGGAGAGGAADGGKALEAWACSDGGRLIKKKYDDAMAFWNGQGHEIYGKLCSTTGGRCAAAKPVVLPYTFKAVSAEPIPSDVVTTWWAHKMDCTPAMKAMHSSAPAGTASWTVLFVSISVVLWNIQHLA